MVIFHSYVSLPEGNHYNLLLAGTECWLSNKITKYIYIYKVQESGTEKQ